MNSEISPAAVRPTVYTSADCLPKMRPNTYSSVGHLGDQTTLAPSARSELAPTCSHRRSSFRSDPRSSVQNKFFILFSVVFADDRQVRQMVDDSFVFIQQTFITE